MKTKRELKCVQKFYNFNKFSQTLNCILNSFSNRLMTQLMPRFRPKPKAVNGRKYSSFWFALKAIQNNRLLRNNWFNENSNAFNKNFLHMNGMNGLVDDNNVSSDQMKSQKASERVDSSDPDSADNVLSDQLRQSTINGFKTIEINDKKSLVLIKNNDFVFELSFGCIRVTLLTDILDIDLNGFRLSADKSVEVMAVFGHKIAIKCQTNDNKSKTDRTDVEIKLKNIGIEDPESVLNQLDDNWCLILIERLCLSSLLYLETNPHFRPSNLKTSNAWFEFKHMPNTCLQSINVWNKLFVDLKFGSKDVIVICGGRNVGKSSLIRHLVNKYLSPNQSEGTDRQCLYLDCDPGQTEFSTSAQISLTRIQRPLLSATALNVTHFKPLMACSVGATTAAKEPKLYISSTSRLSDYFRNDLQSKGPLFVNTMGWTRDLGLALLTDVIKITVPTHVIQIDSLVDQKINFGFDLTPESVRKYNGFGLDRIDSNRGLDYKLSVVGSDNRGSKISQTNRLSQQLSYMSLMPDIVFKPFFAMTPFKILWSNVYLHVISDSRLSSQLILDVLNCSWIQLCRIDDKDIESIESNGIRIVESITGNQCLGSAVIRGIDFENMCFYILSPESPETLCSVNCIVRPSGVQIPEPLLLEQLNHSFTSNVPYVYDKT